MNIRNWLKRFKGSSNEGMLVLMYHRISDTETDPWQLAVSPHNFEQQLQIIKETGLVTTLSDIQHQLYTGKQLKNGILITFDDGYIDNVLTAAPLLQKYHIPATFFISTKHVDTNKEFWWDELGYIFLEHLRLPDKLNLDYKDIYVTFDLDGEEALTDDLKTKHHNWNAYQPPTTKRAQIYLELWKLLSPLIYHDQQDVIKQLKIWAGINNISRKEYYSMSSNQLTELNNNSLFQIGAHSETHPALAIHPEHYQREEILKSKNFIEKFTKISVDAFAYPSGSYNGITISVLRSQNFKLSFTTEESKVTISTNPFRLGRYQVNNWTGQEFSKYFNKWL